MIKYSFLGRKTKATVENTKYDIIEELNKIDSHISRKYNFTMKDHYSSNSICSKDDVFIEQIGKNVAKSRCLYKYYTDKIRILTEFVIYLNELSERISKEIEKVYNVRKNYED